MTFDLDWRPPTFETERLILRPVTADDAIDIFMYCSNPRITQFTLWSTHESIDDTLVFLNDYAVSRYAAKEPDPLGIVMKLDPAKQVIGTVGCFWSSKKDGVMELGYNLAEPFWGQGIIAEAAAAVIDYVFREYPIERLQSRVFVGNSASGRVLQKLGMKFEGCLRSALVVRGKRVEVEYYSLLRSERQPSSALPPPRGEGRVGG